ncbi:MAG TPA: TolC family protein, partial [Planctomycetaceae bacterium]
SQLFQSTYTGATGVQFRQPLLAGGGVEFTRIAGPINPNFGAITGVTQGVLIARINNDITVADFELSVRDLLKDVEDAYWDLYLAYRQFDAAVTARNSALRSWREAQARLEIGGVAGFRPADEAQARDRYFETRAQVEQALNQIYLAESELRRLMGLPPNDGRVIRPIEEPTTARLVPDWHASLTDALMFRTELRRQKWQIKSLQLQLVAAENLTRPRLDVVSQYQVNGFGDKLLSRGDDDEAGTEQGLDSAYETLLQGEQTGWNLGLEFSVPIGFRQAKAQVRNIELRLAKAREVLSAQELDVAHEVADALQAVEFNYRNAETNFNRRIAAARRVELFEQELLAGTVTLDEVLRAQASLATAEIEYFRSVVQYNQSLAYLHLVKGTLLERDNVQLEEGTWTPKAYEQALRRAWERSNAFPNPLLHVEPPPFAIPDDSRQLVCPPEAAAPPAPAGTVPAAGEAAVPPAPTTEPPADGPPPTAPSAASGSAPPPVPPAGASRLDGETPPWDEEEFKLP